MSPLVAGVVEFFQLVPALDAAQLDRSALVVPADRAEYTAKIWKWLHDGQHTSRLVACGPITLSFADSTQASGFGGSGLRLTSVLVGQASSLSL